MKKAKHKIHEMVEFERDWGRIIYALVIYSSLEVEELGDNTSSLHRSEVIIPNDNIVVVYEYSHRNHSLVHNVPLGVLVFMNETGTEYVEEPYSGNLTSPKGSLDKATKHCTSLDQNVFLKDGEVRVHITLPDVRSCRVGGIHS